MNTNLPYFEKFWILELGFGKNFRQNFRFWLVGSEHMFRIGVGLFGGTIVSKKGGFFYVVILRYVTDCLLFIVVI